jgi:hypothetical protein
VFLASARHKHDLTPVVGPHGEEGPALSDDVTIPDLRLEHLPAGETVYRLAEGLPGKKTASATFPAGTGS